MFEFPDFDEQFTELDEQAVKTGELATQSADKDLAVLRIQLAEYLSTLGPSASAVQLKAIACVLEQFEILQNSHADIVKNTTNIIEAHKVRTRSEALGLMSVLEKVKSHIKQE